MIRFRKLLPLAAALAVAVALGTPRKAHAYIEIDYSIDGGARTFLASGTTEALYSGSIGGLFSVTLAYGTTDNSTPVHAIVELSDTNLKTKYTNAGHTLTLYVGAQGFTTPQSPPPLALLDTASGSLTNGSVTGTSQGFADATNALFGQGFAGELLTFSASGGSQSFDQSGYKYGFSPDGATYSLALISNYTITAGATAASLTVTGGNAQTIPTPAPAGAVLALTGLPLLGLGGWLRRRKQA